MYSLQSVERYACARRGLLAAAVAAAGLLLPMTAFAQGKSKSKMELQSFDPLTQDIQTFTWDGRRGLDAAMSRPNHYTQDTRLLNRGAYTTGRQGDLFGTRMNRAGVGNHFGEILGQTAAFGRQRRVSGKSSAGLRSSQTMLSPGLLGPVSLGRNGSMLDLGAGSGSVRHRAHSRPNARRP